MVGGYFADLRATPGRIRDMRVAWCLVIVALATGCGSAQQAPEQSARYGISLEVPEGWDAEVSRGMISIGRGEISVVLYEYETAGANDKEHVYFKDDWPVRLAPAAFTRRTGRDEDSYLVSVSGRLFSVFANAPRAPLPEELEELHAALASIEIEAGDFYPGSVQPVVFPERPGWHVVSSGASPRLAHGESTQTAAATIPYRNGPDDLPPVRTLEALPEDGILVWVSLSRDSHLPPSRLDRNDAYEPRRPPPYRLADLERVDGWVGQIRDMPDYRLWAATGDRYLVDLRVYFGRTDPTKAMREEADAILARLRFPDWGPWELEGA